MNRQELAKIEIRCPSCTVEKVTASGMVHRYKPRMVLVAFGFWGNARFKCTHCQEQIDIVAADETFEMTDPSHRQVEINCNPTKEDNHD